MKTLKLSKVLSLLLAAIMVLGLFAACGDSKKPADSSKAESKSTDKESGTDTEPVDTNTADAELDPVTLKFYFFDGKKAATDEVWDAIADEYRDILNADFEIQFIAGTDYVDKMLVKAASGDKWDMNFDSDWTCYYQMIGQNAYLGLNDLLPTYAPDLYQAYEESGVLEAAKSKGEIVALPWTMLMTMRPFFQWRGDLVEAAGLDIKEEDINTIEDIDRLVTELRTAYPDRKILENSNVDAWLVQSDLSSLPHSFVFDLNDDEYRVIPVEQTEAYMEMAKYGHKWQEEGIIWKDILTDQTDHNQLIDQGQLITKWGTHEFANSTRPWAEEGAYWAKNPIYLDNKYANRTPLANACAIPRTSENPERALMFLNQLEIDQKLYDMVHYGILGETYELDGETAVYPEGMTAANSNYMDWGGRWAYWKPQFMRPDATYDDGFWVRESEFVKSNPNNIPSPLDGFDFDIDPIKVELSQRTQIYDDANKMITVGLAGDPVEAVNKLIEQQKAAGLDVITAELQRQIDEFVASKG